MTLFDKIVKAQHNLDGVVLKTPLQFSINLSEKFQASIYLKREDLQQVRSYKIRGAYNKISHLNAQQKTKGMSQKNVGSPHIRKKKKPGSHYAHVRIFLYIVLDIN